MTYAPRHPFWGKRRASPGVKTAALHIANNDSDESPFDLTITGTGTGVAPEIAVEQPLGMDLVDGVGNKDFGSVAVGANRSLVFTILNTGTADLTGLGITLDGADAAQFSVTVDPVAPVSGPIGSTTFTVRFAPVSSGAKTAALHIANNDSDENPFDITITGGGVAPEIAVEQPLGANLVDGGSKTFGLVAVGFETSLDFTIKNTGTANLTGLGITIDGVDAALFSLTASPTTPVTGPSGRTTLTVRFAPTSTGLKTAALHIVSNDSDENPFDITITGTGTGAVVLNASAIILNPQTGLFEQTVRLINNSPNTLAATRLLIQGLPGDVQVRNASGSTNGIPFLHYNLPFLAGGILDLVIEYYRANRQTVPQPTFAGQTDTVTSPTPTGTFIAIDRIVQLTSGRFLIEFSATPGRSYAMQYSGDLSSWKTAQSTIIAASNRVQWYDDGPPKTDSPPTSGSRFYRVVELP